MHARCTPKEFNELSESTLPTDGEITGISVESRWPQCANTGCLCFAYEFSRRLGKNLCEELLDYIWSADEGSRLSLQCNRGGFTMQVTGPVRKTSKRELSLDELRAIGKRLRSNEVDNS